MHEYRVYDVVYTVRADSMKEAIRKAEAGDTVAEEMRNGLECIHERFFLDVLMEPEEE